MFAHKIDLGRAEFIGSATPQAPAPFGVNMGLVFSSIPACAAIQHVARVGIDINTAFGFGQDMGHEARHHVEQLVQRTAGLQPFIQFTQQANLSCQAQLFVHQLALFGGPFLQAADLNRLVRWMTVTTATKRQKSNPAEKRQRQPDAVDEQIPDRSELYPNRTRARPESARFQTRACRFQRHGGWKTAALSRCSSLNDSTSAMGFSS